MSDPVSASPLSWCSPSDSDGVSSPPAPGERFEAWFRKNEVDLKIFKLLIEAWIFLVASLCQYVTARGQVH